MKEQNVASPVTSVASSAADFVYHESFLGPPGLSEEQRGELKILRAELAMRRGKRGLAEAASVLERARAAFEAVIALGTPRANEAEHWRAEIDKRLETMRELAKAVTAPSRPLEPRTPEAELPRWRL
jgi:hypothetical protein